MKKLICGFFFAWAGIVLADSISATVATVDVIEVDSRLTNTVVAIPGLDLAGGNLAISNLVRTTNLTNGDKLYAFDGHDYETWVLEGGVWTKHDKLFTVNASGQIVAGTGTPSSLMTMSVGSGIWLSRQDVSKKFYIYGAQPNTKTSVAVAGAISLVGNPALSCKRPVSFVTSVLGDKIIIPTSTVPKTYTYSEKNEVRAWRNMTGGVLSEELPEIPAGTGFWYVSTGGADVTINW